jgi:hypothetical protein
LILIVWLQPWWRRRVEWIVFLAQSKQIPDAR